MFLIGQVKEKECILNKDHLYTYFIVLLLTIYPFQLLGSLINLLFKPKSRQTSDHSKKN